MQQDLKTIRTYFGIAHPWLCDNMGHLNTRNYVAMFDDACAHYLAAIGWSPEDVRTKGCGWADVRGEIEYKAELRQGGQVTIDTGTESIGRKSLTLYSEMRGSVTNALHATMRSVLVHFDVEARRAIPVPDELRHAVSEINYSRLAHSKGDGLSLGQPIDRVEGRQSDSSL